MRFGVLAGKEKDSYLERLIDALEVGESQIPGGDCGFYGSLLRIAAFGRELPELEILMVAENGMPGVKVLHTLLGHKKLIEQEQPEEAKANELIGRIQSSIYENNFSFTDDLRQLRRALFSARLRDLDFTGTRKLTLEEGEELEDGRKLNLVLRGYDVAESSWIRYDAHLYCPPKRLLSRNPYVTHWGMLKPKERLETLMQHRFAQEPHEWIGATGKHFYTGLVRKQSIIGFRGPGETPLQQELKENEWVLEVDDLLYEDTDVTMQEPFDDSCLDGSHTPELLREHRRLLVTTPEVAPRLHGYAKHQPYNCEVRA